ncbi:hypothetical protein [Hydrogenophaga sp.]|uniref:hypothetical protein n=1 Tax=Hydrogenophaga sp. TaxID=1904254 RepID=UPI003F6F2B13
MKLARERGVAQDLYAEKCLVSKRLRSLAKQRNFAAHNAPMAHVFESIDTGQLEIRFEVRGVNNSERLVTQDALQAWFKDAVALENDLALLAGCISKPTSE